MTSSGNVPGVGRDEPQADLDRLAAIASTRIEKLNADPTNWTAWQGDKTVSCPSIHPDLDEQCSLGYGHGEAHRTTTYWSDDA